MPLYGMRQKKVKPPSADFATIACIIDGTDQEEIKKIAIKHNIIIALAICRTKKGKLIVRSTNNKLLLEHISKSMHKLNIEYP